MLNNSVAMYVGLRYARASKSNPFIAFINFFSVTGIALGLMSLILVSSVMNGFESQLKQRILGVTPHMLIDTHQVDTSLQNTLEQWPNVLGHTQFIESEAIVQSSSELKGVMIQGIAPQESKYYEIVNQSMLYADLKELQAGEYRVIMGHALASQLKVRIGDEVRILMPGSSHYGPFGRVPAQRKFVLAGLYEVGSELDDKVIMVNIQDVRKLMRKKTADIVETRIFLKDAFQYQDVANTLKQMGLSVRDWRSRQGPLFDAVKMEKNMMALMLLLIIAVAAFNIVSALVMLVSEKKSDIAILRTQGMTDANVMGLFLITGAYNGIKGTVIGLLGGLLLASQINNVLDLLGIKLLPVAIGQGIPVDLQSGQVALMSALCLIFCIVATIYPAYKAVRQQPAEALRYE